TMSRPTPVPAPSLAATPSTERERERERERTEREEPAEKSAADIPFYRKAIAHIRGDDPNGFGPNWSNVDDYDIPTVLRKQMD
ncbi:MAG: hypothetical protein ABIS20_25585, partial [Thermoanaerobaculia bacterium]